MAKEASQQAAAQEAPKGGPDLSEANKRLTGENAQKSSPRVRGAPCVM